MRRRHDAERMDAPDATWPEFQGALRDLAFLSRISRAYPPVLRFLDRVVAAHGVRSLSVLDVGAGGGDTIARIVAWGAKRGVAVTPTALDRSPWAARYAAETGVAAEYVTTDLFELDPARRFDVVVCSLFAHHLDDPTLVRFLRWIDARATRGWLISDLHRHRIPWAAVWAGTRALGLHPMVSHDGPISIAKALTGDEWRAAIAAAGVAAELRWAFPFRWQVSAIRPTALP